MLVIHFSDRDAEKRALALLVGRFPGRALRGGGHWVPAGALKILSSNNIQFRVQTNPERRMAAVRGAAAAPIQ